MFAKVARVQRAVQMPYAHVVFGTTFTFCAALTLLALLVSGIVFLLLLFFGGPHFFRVFFWICSCISVMTSVWINLSQHSPQRTVLVISDAQSSSS